MEELDASFEFVIAATLYYLHGVVYFLAVLKIKAVKIVSKIYTPWNTYWGIYVHTVNENTDASNICIKRFNTNAIQIY